MAQTMDLFGYKAQGLSVPIIESHVQKGNE